MSDMCWGVCKHLYYPKSVTYSSGLLFVFLFKKLHAPRYCPEERVIEG